MREWKASSHVQIKPMLTAVFYLTSFHIAILATHNTQFGQEMALVMQTTHAQRWQYPDHVD